MPNFNYKVEYAHGSAQGTVQADDEKQAESKARAMYHGQPFDTVDEKGKPIVKITEVTNVTVNLIQE
jgi:hypothetical protein